MGRRTKTWCAAALALAPALAPAAEDIAAKGFPLVALILKPVLERVGERLSEKAADAASERIGGPVGSLFQRLLGSEKTEVPVAAADAAASASGAAPLPQAALPGVTPSILYALDRLDPQSFAAQAPLDVTGKRPVLKTGDAFALRFATNLPGQVRIENVDAQGVRSPLGVYNVLPGQDNRIPRTKGIQLAGSTGVETFNLDFYPCLPPEAAGLRGYAVYKDALPPCGSGAFDHAAGVQVAMRGVVRTRAAVNLELGDPKMVVAALPDFKPLDIVHQSFTLLHEAR